MNSETNMKNRKDALFCLQENPKVRVSNEKYGNFPYKNHRWPENFHPSKFFTDSTKIIQSKM